MPQFDFTTYSAQIFWFSICFFVLYYFMASIILPRIRGIIADRKNVISDDLLSADSLNEKNDESRTKIDEILREADLKYKTAIDLAVKEAAQRKEKFVEEFKNNAENLIEKSKAEINKMIANSDSQNHAAIEKLVTLTQNKIFNS